MANRMIHDSSAKDQEIEELKNRLSQLEHTNKYLQKQLDIMNLTAEQKLLGLLVFQENHLCFYNRAVLDITAYNAEEIHDWKLEDFYALLYPEDLKILINLRNNHLTKKDEDILHHSFRIKNKNGQELWIDQYEKTILIGAQSTHFIYFMDITLQKQLESIMVNQEVKNRNFIHSLPMGIHMYHYTHDQLIFTGANPAADRILGLKNKKFIGKTIEEAFPNLANPEITSIYKTLAREGGMWEKEQIIYENNIIKGAYYISAFQTSPHNMAAVFIEITEKTQLQEKIKQNENQYRSLFEGSPDGIFLLDRDFNITMSNHNGAKLLGFPARQEVAGKNLLSFIFEKDRQVFENRLKDFLENPYFKPQDIQIRKANDKTFFSEIHLSAIEEGNDINHIIAIIRDITERYINQMEIERSEELFRGIFENAMDGMAVASLDTREILLVNQKICHTVGYTEEEFLNKKTQDLLPKEYRDNNPSLLLANSNGGNEISTNIPIQTKDGKIIYMDIASNKIVINQKEYLIGIFRDITKRKQAEDEIKKNKEKLEAIFNHSPVMLILLNSKLEVIESNKTFCDQMGWDPDEITGRHLDEAIGCYHFKQNTNNNRSSELCNNCDLKKIVLETLNNLTGVHHNSVSIKHGPKDEDTADYAISSTPIKLDKRWGVLVSLEDITRQKKIEESLIQRQKIDTIKVLAGGLAHDFNNMLTGIIGNISLAKMYYPQKEELFRSLNEAEGGAFRAQHLTEQLLSFAKGGSPEKQVASIEELTKEALNFALSGSQIKYNLSIDKGIKQVLIDQGQIHQVLNNLIINAQQAMPDGGHINISIKNRQIDSKNDFNLDNGDYVEVKIQDTGKGIPKELQKKVFDPFFTTKKSGNGLGLATCYSIISRHNGFIGLESTPETGALFTIYLPTAIAEQKVEPKYKDNDFLKGKCILLMDDDQDILSTTSLQLKAIGCKVIQASNGEQAIEKFINHYSQNIKIDIALLDLTVKGGMGAIKTLQALKQIDPSIKAIVTSGYSGDKRMEQFNDFGFNGKITKPFRIIEIKQALKDFFEK